MGSISVQVERGKIYFVQARVAGRFQAETAFQLVTEAEGKAAVLRSVLIRPRQAAINE
jgi:ATP-dependent phosphoenolpyruvate carboxykinase